jgi:hypothetical protein
MRQTNTPAGQTGEQIAFFPVLQVQILQIATGTTGTTGTPHKQGLPGHRQREHLWEQREQIAVIHSTK